MSEAIRNFAHYRAAGTGWMLGRFVCSASALTEFSEIADPLLPRDAGAIPWRISVTGSGDVASDMSAIEAFNERHRVCFDECSATVDCYETKVTSVQDVQRLHSVIPEKLLAYLEVPPSDGIDTIISTIASTGRRAKIRTGGTVTSAFPKAQDVVKFLQSCISNKVTAKATAGLHHPLAGMYRLTYKPDAPTGVMFGFANVVLAAALLVDGAAGKDAVDLLGESKAQSISVDDTSITWSTDDRTFHIDRSTIKHVRDSVLVSIGSCSFTEPVDESRALGWI